jgi:patatin-like phospholipase/acyl hydrolase
MFKILSLDGGGIRGIISTMVLREIENATGRPIHESFDLIAGTSTGGIMALLLTKPGDNGKAQYNCDDIVRLYEVEGKNMFKNSILHSVISLFGAASSKYPGSYIEEVLGRYFGETRLSAALTDLLITSYETELRSSYFFKTKHAAEDDKYDFKMKDVARATSAAPTYFPPFKLVESSSKYLSMLDGGVFANNPAMCALAEALQIDPDNMEEKVQQHQVVLVSLGTGSSQSKLPYNIIKDWSLLSWARKIVDISFDGVSDTIDYQLKTILSSDRYFRFQIPIELNRDAMDNFDPENLSYLKRIGYMMVNTFEKQLVDVCYLLK